MHWFQLLSVLIFITRGNLSVKPALYFSVGTSCAALICNIFELRHISTVTVIVVLTVSDRATHLASLCVRQLIESMWVGFEDCTLANVFQMFFAAL